MANLQMGLVARKLGMTQIFNDDGEVLPVTVLEVTPNTILQVKTPTGKDGYSAVQIGYGVRRDSRNNKALTGHASKANVESPKVVREVRLAPAEAGTFQLGQKVGVTDLFAAGGFVDVTGTSKGKGFAGVMKRHNFKGFINSHGNHEYFRHGGSIGTRLTPGMTLKGVRMPGQMGNQRVDGAEHQDRGCGRREEPALRQGWRARCHRHHRAGSPLSQGHGARRAQGRQGQVAHPRRCACRASASPRRGSVVSGGLSSLAA